LFINTNQFYEKHLPYPLLFVHGLTGDNSNWENLKDTLPVFYGLNYGGNMNFCLNQDGDNLSANINNDYKDWTNENNLKIGDFYTINFDVDTFGKSNPTSAKDVRSNQSAIFKQGIAIKDAIKHILKVSSSDKVIVVGHSMGGLALREYLENPLNWQIDGKHHVAKYLSIGTPHGGSNATSLNLTGITGLGPDEKSEAVRDLRAYYTTNYGLTKDTAAFLFGGIEDGLNFISIPSFYNYDVNCDGKIGDKIVGLNKKS
jgi:triacylglycerol esterase/lipase EstA (alpha/beta hydrolase family)